jgi:hypothetical protein
LELPKVRAPFVPSVLTLAIVISSLLWCTVIGALMRWPGPSETRLESREDAHPKRLGEDFSAPYEAAKDFMRHQRVYWPAVKRHPVYDYIPQSLVVVWPFAAFFSFRSGYYSLILISSSALYVLLMASALLSSRRGAYHYAVMFPILMFVSEGGSLLYKRGNLDALAAVAAAAAFLCMLGNKDRTAAFFLALMTCVKPIYVPFAAFLLLFKERWRMVGIYAGVHLLACSALVLFDGSLSIFTDYLRYVPGYVSYMKDWVGGYNISLLSTLSQWFPSRQPELMSLGASFLVLGLGTLGGLFMGFAARRKGPPERDALPLYFLYFAYVCLLWQCVSMMYAALVLLPTIPALDTLYCVSASRWLRFGVLAHAVLLGIIFTPYIRQAPLDEKGPCYLLALLAAGWVLACSRFHAGAGSAAPVTHPMSASTAVSVRTSPEGRGLERVRHRAERDGVAVAAAGQRTGDVGGDQRRRGPALRPQARLGRGHDLRGDPQGVALARPHREAGACDLHLQLPPLTRPLALGRRVTQEVVDARFRGDAQCVGAQVVRVAHREAAGVHGEAVAARSLRLGLLDLHQAELDAVVWSRELGAGHARHDAARTWIQQSVRSTVKYLTKQKQFPDPAVRPDDIRMHRGNNGLDAP